MLTKYSSTETSAASSLIRRIDDISASFCELCNAQIFFGWDVTTTGDVRLCRTCARCGVIESEIVRVVESDAP